MEARCVLGALPKFCGPRRPTLMTELKVIVSGDVYGVLGHCDPRGCIPLRRGEARARELALGKAETACRRKLALEPTRLRFCFVIEGLRDP